MLVPPLGAWVPAVAWLVVLPVTGMAEVLATGTAVAATDTEMLGVLVTGMGMAGMLVTGTGTAGVLATGMEMEGVLTTGTGTAGVLATGTGTAGVLAGMKMAVILAVVLIDAGGVLNRSTCSSIVMYVPSSIQEFRQVSCSSLDVTSVDTKVTLISKQKQTS